MAGSDFREIDYNQSVAEILKPYADDGDVNKDLRFIMQCFFGAEQPSPIYPYMFWADTANGYLKQRNGTNDAWEIRSLLGSDSFLRNGLYPMSGNLDLGNYKIQNLLGTLYKAATELTIAGGAFTVTQMLHTVDTEADAASDELDTINGGGTIDMIILRAENDARTVVLKHNTGNIWIPGGADILLDDIRDAVLLWWDGTKWIVLGGTPANYRVFAIPETDLLAIGDIETVTVDTNGVGVGAALVQASDGHYDEADADAAATMPCTRLALETGTGSKKVLIRGYIRNDAWNWTTKGAWVYVSATQGALSESLPGSGKYAQAVAEIKTADILFFDPSPLQVKAA